jgi:hypothetical protein
MKAKRGMSVEVALIEAGETVTGKETGLLIIPLWSVIRRLLRIISP